jgi:hypothetical protein
MACLDPRNIFHAPFFLRLHLKKERLMALGLLDAYSFTTSQKDGLLRLHRLVYLATRSWMRANGLLHALALKAADRLEEIFPDDDHRNANK